MTPSSTPSTADRPVESTRELLWERGCTGTSPRAIQQRAGAGQGSMYHHFAGKPELALAAITRTAQELLAVAEGRAAGELPPHLDPDATAATVVAVLQGGYVLARAAGDPGPFDRAVTGLLALLTPHPHP